VIETPIDFEDVGGTALKGWLYVGEQDGGPRPGILVIPDAPGLGPMPVRRAQMLAELGYAAFVAGLYGDGPFVGYTPEAETLANQMIANPALLLGRAEAGLRAMISLPAVDSARLAAVGYCLGRMALLHLVRSGAQLSAAVAFHGLLAPYAQGSRQPNVTSLLICTGPQWAAAAKGSTYFIPVDLPGQMLSPIQTVRATLNTLPLGSKAAREYLAMSTSIYPDEGESMSEASEAECRLPRSPSRIWLAILPAECRWFIGAEW
jgi:dienelactone hydrolase